MKYEEFLNTVNAENHPSKELSVQLRSLWYDKKGDWQSAHDLIDHLEDQSSAHVHAYLHRVEGDIRNARYWYNRAEEPFFEGSLLEEWETLVKYFLLNCSR